MRYKEEYFHCSDYLKETFKTYLDEIRSCVDEIPWQPDFKVTVKGHTYEHQTGYNKALGLAFVARGWELQPVLKRNPRLIGDFRKHLVFVEVQFGNSASLFRDYYKFQYGLANGLLSLAVLIVPT